MKTKDFKTKHALYYNFTNYHILTCMKTDINLKYYCIQYQ